MSKALSTVVAIALGGLALAPVIYSAQNPAPVSEKLEQVKLDQNSSNLQKISYMLGYALGQQTPPEADMPALIAGQKDAREGKQPVFTNEEMAAALEAYNKEMAEKEAKQQEKAAEPVDTKGYVAEQAKFLVENAKKEGVKTTTSGLQYKVIQEGSGKQATPESTVTVHYTGKTIDGNIFDSSVQRGQPATFPLSQVIKGWTEGVSLMKEGSKVELYIPAELAYAGQEKPGIPANSALIFEVELLKVE